MSDSGEYCTWMGRYDVKDGEAWPLSDRSAATGGGVFDGTAGIALFMMELFNVTGIERFKEVAVSAWLRSVVYLQKSRRSLSPRCFYDGELGVLYVGCRMAEIEPRLKPKLASGLHWLSERVARRMDVKSPCFSLAVKAGAIRPLLKLSERYDLIACREVARSCAEQLVQGASWSGEICFWDMPLHPDPETAGPALNGYASGSSAVGLSLLEAYTAFGDERYLTHANAAFLYDETLSPVGSCDGWQEEGDRGARPRKFAERYRNLWCRGDQGEALRHLRAAQIDEASRDYFNERAKSSIGCMQRAIREDEGRYRGDASLWHGIFGVFDAMVSYASACADSDVLLESREAATRYLSGFDNVAGLPSGLVSGGYSPSLMLGLAGVGLGCVRLYEPETPSPFLL